MATGPTTETRSGGVAITHGSNVTNPRLARKHEITSLELQEIIKKVGRPWFNRRKRIPLRRIQTLRGE